VRLLLVLPLIGFWAIAVKAQKEDRTLFDRLLKPDTTLQNAAEQKRFVTSDKTIDKKITTRVFQPAGNSLSREFPGAREISARELQMPRFRDGSKRVNNIDNTDAASPDLAVAQTKTLALRNAAGNNRQIAPMEFAGSRPFLIQGKSQRAASEREGPLTVEQVRELLNKNK